MTPAFGGIDMRNPMSKSTASVPSPANGPRSKATLPLFLSILLVASAVVETSMIRAGGIDKAPGLVALTMFLPALSAIVAMLLTLRSLRGIGWRLGRPKYLLAALLLPVAIVIPAYALVWITGLSVPDFQRLSHVAKLNFGLDAGPWLSLLVILAVGLIIDSIMAAGEEIGWRGLLLTELGQRTAKPRAALMVGALWAIWHWPGILFGGYTSPIAPIWYSITCFTVMVLGWSMVLAWLRFRSGSLWPAVLMHGAHNLVIQAVFDAITPAKSTGAYLTGEFGAGVALCYVVAGVVAYRAMGRMDDV